MRLIRSAAAVLIAALMLTACAEAPMTLDDHMELVQTDLFEGSTAKEFNLSSDPFISKAELDTAMVALTRSEFEYDLAPSFRIVSLVYNTGDKSLSPADDITITAEQEEQELYIETDLDGDLEAGTEKFFDLTVYLINLEPVTITISDSGSSDTFTYQITD